VLANWRADDPKPLLLGVDFGSDDPGPILPTPTILSGQLRSRGSEISSRDTASASIGLRRLLAKTRDGLFYTVPPRWRGRLAEVLPSRLAPSLTKQAQVDQFFDEGGDPFGFDANPKEQVKFQRTLEVCGEGDLGRVLEIGCAVGSFTELIAPRATDVLAIDVSEAAIKQAEDRMRGYPHVHLEARTLPADFPDGPFDLIVASDVLYYLTVDDLQTCLSLIEERLAPGGALVAVHYIPRVGTLLNGDELHDYLAEHTTMTHTLDERVELGQGRPYRLDRYEKT
jgi:SAM-dependent methyltransferase